MPICARSDFWYLLGNKNSHVYPIRHSVGGCPHLEILLKMAHLDSEMEAQCQGRFLLARGKQWVRLSVSQPPLMLATCAQPQCCVTLTAAEDSGVNLEHLCEQGWGTRKTEPPSPDWTTAEWHNSSAGNPPHPIPSYSSTKHYPWATIHWKISSYQGYTVTQPEAGEAQGLVTGAHHLWHQGWRWHVSVSRRVLPQPKMPPDFKATESSAPAVQSENMRVFKSNLLTACVHPSTWKVSGRHSQALHPS